MCIRFYTCMHFTYEIRQFVNNETRFYQVNANQIEFLQICLAKYTLNYVKLKYGHVIIQIYYI